MYQGPEHGLIGVLDGLGGAGGEIIQLSDGSERTGAWVASRRTQDVVRTVYRRMIQQLSIQGPSDASNEGSDRTNERSESQTPFDFTAEVSKAIREDLTQFASQVHIGGNGRLRSKMIKALPTTLAACWYDLGRNEYTAVWAGDSRIYCLHPKMGLQQVTTDDLKTNADALENLTYDALMSNYVSASADFVLHERRLRLSQPCVLLAATDGCFGYVQTPLHFEYLLLSSMQNSRGWQEWEEEFVAEITQITSDDSTLSAAVIGWPDFSACREAYASRFKWCEEQVRAHDSRRAEIDRMEQAPSIAREELAVTRRQMWQEYRRTYEIPAHAPTRHVPNWQGGNPSARPRDAREDKGDDGEES
jgi:serine/threonine protein phosphatase PrpC